MPRSNIKLLTFSTKQHKILQRFYPRIFLNQHCWHVFAFMLNGAIHMHNWLITTFLVVFFNFVSFSLFSYLFYLSCQVLKVILFLLMVGGAWFSFYYMFQVFFLMHPSGTTRLLFVDSVLVAGTIFFQSSWRVSNLELWLICFFYMVKWTLLYKF